jgi:hypothetical protein
MVRSLRLLCLLSANLLVCSALSTFTPASALSSQPAALSICGAERPAVVLMAAASASEPVRSAEMALLHVHLFNFLLKVPHFVAYDCNACLCAWLWSLSDPSGDYQCAKARRAQKTTGQGVSILLARYKRHLGTSRTRSWSAASSTKLMVWSA